VLVFGIMATGQLMCHAHFLSVALFQSRERCKDAFGSFVGVFITFDLRDGQLRPTSAVTSHEASASHVGIATKQRQHRLALGRVFSHSSLKSMFSIIIISNQLPKQFL
jgi:hypothetical protein